MSNLSIIESDSVIVSMTRASQALAEAVTIGQTKTLIDVAHAAEIYSKRHHLSDEAIGKATAVKVEATRKLGEILAVTPKSTGAKGIGKSAVPKENHTLEELGLSKKESMVAQKLAALPEKQFEQVRLGNVTIAKAIAAVDSKPKEKEVKTITPIRPEYTNEDRLSDQLKEAHNTINEMMDEMQSLKDGIATEGDPDAKEIIKSLREENRILAIELETIKSQRSILMGENKELMSQCKYYERKLKAA